MPEGREAMMNIKETRIPLEGAWNLTLLSAEGEKKVCQSVHLPSTVTEQGYGEENSRQELLFLSEKKKFVGTAVFEREFVLPDFGCSRVLFCMERTRSTRVFVNGGFAGSRDALTTEQRYDITSLAHPGENHILVEVDNTYRGAPRDAILCSHMASEHTQTNWNGILGRIEIRVVPFFQPSCIRVLPNARDKTALVKIDFDALPKACDFREAALTVRITQPDFLGQGEVTACVTQKKRVPARAEAEAERESLTAVVALDPDTPLWSEFSPDLTRILVETECGADAVIQEVPFGLRTFDVDPDHHHFRINGLRTFLRSEANCCVFPLTGYAPMDEESWERLLLTYQSYGVNCVRFHSWCPPEAAFCCADRLGIYLQPELCAWSFHMFEEDGAYDYYTREAQDIARAYANHPSFVAMTWGNELRSANRERMGALCRKMRTFDPTRLYAEGSNTWYGENGISKESDFVMAQQNGGSIWRGAFAGNHGFLNAERPGEDHTYTRELEDVPVPAVSFEVGQFQSYPDYSEIGDYRGTLEARNLQHDQRTLQEHGMEGLDRTFHRSSGILAQRCYRAEIEAAMRTPNLAGISLLGLQDFPGQGTALVGMMDAFGRPKAFSDPAVFHRFFSDVVPLLSFSKYCYQEQETAVFAALVHNFGPSDLSDPVEVKIRDARGAVLFEKKWVNADLPQGAVSEVGRFSFILPAIGDGIPKILTACIRTGSHGQDYDLYVYPAPRRIPQESIVTKLDEETFSRLAKGEKLLFLPERTPESIPGGYPVSYISGFWCWIMFSKSDPCGTLGICPRKDAALWKDFPTSAATDPRWWSLLHGARAVRVTGTGAEVLLSAIDNIQRNEKLSLLMQAKVGEGALLISTCSTENPKDPAVNAYLHALLHYLHSGHFLPEGALTKEELLFLFPGERPELAETGAVRSITAGVNQDEAANVLSGDGRSWSTIGSTSEAENYLELSFDQKRRINTVRLLFLPDAAAAKEGADRILPDSYEVYCRVNGAWQRASVLFQSAVSDSGENVCYFRPVFADGVKIHLLLHAGAGVDVMGDAAEKRRDFAAVQRVGVLEAPVLLP